MVEIDKTKPQRNHLNILVTYSQADSQTFPTRESFAPVVVASFTSKQSKVVPLHLACFLEKHESGGCHWHVALKLRGEKWQLEVKRFIEAEHEIAVNFFDHDSFYAAYRYINKSDDIVFHSTGHPGLCEIGSQRTRHYQQTYRKRRR